ncbi:MAG: MmcQ/YjbR family DNA-binding protein [Flavobacteriales bacterium]
MNIEEYRNYCLKKKGVTESFPFDENTLVFKVMGKMFALCDVDEFESINLKAAPEEIDRRKEEYNGVLPGYHMNKKYWVTVLTNGVVSDQLLFEWIDISYEEVIKGLTKKLQAELKICK